MAQSDPEVPWHRLSLSGLPAPEYLWDPEDRYHLAGLLVRLVPLAPPVPEDRYHLAALHSPDHPSGRHHHERPESPEFLAGLHNPLALHSLSDQCFQWGLPVLYFLWDLLHRERRESLVVP